MVPAGEAKPCDRPRPSRDNGPRALSHSRHHPGAPPDGTVVPVGGARLRALLTVLALRAGRTVPAGLLVDEVWAGDPPADATGALQALVGRLRRALGADAVASADGGYRLAAAPTTSTCTGSTGWPARGPRPGRRRRPQGRRRPRRRPRPVARAGPRRPARPQRRGGPLGDPAPGRRTRPAHRRPGPRARRAGAAGADRPVRRPPLDEPLQALRLRALRATGRTAEALAAYEEVRRVLADRLGSDPGPELRSLHAGLLRPDPLPEPEPSSAPGPRAATGSRAATGARATGERPARGISGPGSPPSSAGTPTSRPSARTWPAPGWSPCSARRRRQDPAVAGGRRGGRDPARDGVWLAELAPVDDPDAVPEAVLTAVGARETVLYGAGAEEMRAVADRQTTALERLVEHCGRRRMLIVLDNCEHVIEAAARLAEELLARCPTSPSSPPAANPSASPANCCARWSRCRSRPPCGCSPTAAPPPAPASAWTTTPRPAPRSAGAWTACPRHRTGRGPAADAHPPPDRRPAGRPLPPAHLRQPHRPARQQTLRAVVDWSWDLLDAGEREVLGRLSVFAGGCDLAAAEAVCGPAALEALGSLVDKSLVVAAPPATGRCATGCWRPSPSTRASGWTRPAGAARPSGPI